MCKAFVLVALFLLAACANAATSPADPPPAGESVNYQCSTDADCAVKNVGNCCGYYPACVNRDSPTFPDRVKAECARKNMMGVCGFPTIAACSCVQGQCVDAGGDGHAR